MRGAINNSVKNSFKYHVIGLVRVDLFTGVVVA